MTNEEAIEELKTRYLTMSQCLDKEELHKANNAIDMAIQALEKEPKIKAEIEKQEKWLLQAGYNAYNVDIAFDAIKSVIAESEDKE